MCLFLYDLSCTDRLVYHTDCTHCQVHVLATNYIFCIPLLNQKQQNTPNTLESTSLEMKQEKTQYKCIKTLCSMLRPLIGARGNGGFSVFIME